VPRRAHSPCVHLKDDTSEADWLLRREVANEDDVTDCRRDSTPGGQYAGDDEQRVHEWPSLLVRSRCQHPTSRKNRPQLIASDSRSRCFLPSRSSASMPIARLDSGVSEHKFKIGQLVYFHPKGALRPQLDAVPGPYQITKRLPAAEDGEFQYEIRNTLEEYNRVARESDLNACWGRRCLRVQRCSTGFVFPVTTHGFRFRQFLFLTESTRESMCCMNIVPSGEQVLLGSHAAKRFRLPHSAIARNDGFSRAH
jgi:hypothetical protein